MPDRTTIVMPPALKQRAVLRARQQGMSFGQFVRQALETELNTVRPTGRSADPFLDNLVMFDDDGPADWSTRVDEIIGEALEDELRRQRSASGAASRKRSVQPGRDSRVAGTRKTRRK